MSKGQYALAVFGIGVVSGIFFTFVLALVRSF